MSRATNNRFILIVYTRVLDARVIDEKKRRAEIEIQISVYTQIDWNTDRDSMTVYTTYTFEFSQMVNIIVTIINPIVLPVFFQFQLIILVDIVILNPK